MNLLELIRSKNGTLKLAGVVSAGLMCAIWIFMRVQSINPAILQDEWIYSITSRQYSPWAQDLPFDFGNYLFNLVYSSTVLCGQGFYTCAKILNIAFVFGFAFTLFLVALRFLPYWASGLFMVLTLLSPISIYTSMYLPEPMFFFLLSLVLYILIRFSESPSWKSWALAGAVLGVAALVKPHAMIAAMAVGIYLLISTLQDRPYFRTAGTFSAALVGGFFSARILLGFLIAGPKSLNVLGAYGAADSVGTFVGGVASGSALGEATETLVGAGTVVGAVGLFPAQFYVHSLVAAALLGAGFVAIVIAIANTFFNKSEIRPAHRLALLTFIWFVVMVVSIVLFTGWVTGSGDDHTTRVLLRYYDYLFPVVTMAGLAVAFDGRILRSTPLWMRLVAIAPVFVLISIAFSGYFGQLTIQIADAPNLAGLVVDQTTLNVTANLTFLALIVMAFLPKFTIWSMAFLVPWVMVGTGWQIQDQYQGFREADSAADSAGLFTRDFLEPTDLDSLLILAESRFDGRVASFWLEHNTQLELLNPGSTYSVSQLPEGTDWVLTIGQLALDSGEVVSSEEGFQLIRVKK